MPHSRSRFVYAVRRFMLDYESWGWGNLKISPARHLSTPDTPLFRQGVNPRVIDDPVWLKLVWANLNLRKEDLLSEIHYPLSMLQAMAVIWTHAGLRQNELMRLTTECVTPQADDILQENGSAIPAGTLCYLSVLIDHDSEAASLTGPATYYDLGDSYCTPPFWSSCQHRMACIGCDFNLLKQPGGISIPC